MDSQIGTFSSNALEPEKTSAAVLAPSTLGDDVNVEKSTDEEKIKERKQVLHRRINSVLASLGDIYSVPRTCTIFASVVLAGFLIVVIVFSALSIFGVIHI